MHALRFVRDGQTEPTADAGHDMRRFLRTLMTTIRIEQNSGGPWGAFPRPKSFFEKLEKWKRGLEPELESFKGDQQSRLQALVDKIEALCLPRRVQYAHQDFTRHEVQELLAATSEAHSAFGGTDVDVIPADVDAPRPFEGDIPASRRRGGGRMLNVSEHIETLLVRIRALLTDSRMKPIMEDAGNTTLDQWLADYIGSDNAEARLCIGDRPVAGTNRGRSRRHRRDRPHVVRGVAALHEVERSQRCPRCW